MDTLFKIDQSTLGPLADVPKKRTGKSRSSKQDGGNEKKAEARKVKRKLHEFEQKTETLTQIIADKNMEIADLKRSVKSLNEVLNSVPIDELRCNSSIASAKLLELSKANRQLRAEMEALKSSCSKKDMQIQKLERDLKCAGEKFKTDTELLLKGNSGPVDELQNRLHTLQQRLFESRNRNVEMQNQLKLAQKCLQQEVGESFNLNLLASHPEQSQWRGRAQQIIHLQQKISELKDRLAAYEDQGVAHPQNFSCSMEGDASSVKSKKKQKKRVARSELSLPFDDRVASFDRFKPCVRKSEILHRAKVESLEKEINDLKNQIEEQRSKILALKVRNKTLYEEVIKYKMKASAMEEQKDYDFNLVTIDEKLNMQKYQYESQLEELRHEITNLKKEREEAEFKLEEFSAQVYNLEQALMTRNAHIDELNGTIKKLEDDMKALIGGFLFSCRELRKDEFIGILTAVETEKNRLVEYNKDQYQRLQEERTKNQQLSEQLSKQKIRVSRLEAKIRELEKEVEGQSERKKRSQRIAEYANSVTSMSGSLASFTFENTTLALSASNCMLNEQISQPQLDNLKNQLEFANEKITYLEEKISHLEEEKDNDFKVFDEAMRNTKNIILDAIKGNKEGKESLKVEECLSNEE